MTGINRDKLTSRLSETFGRDTQDITAQKLNTTQGNVSKWINGLQVPTTDMLFNISKAYNVSVDWLLGISDEKEIDGIVLEKLTYEQIGRILDRLLVYGNLVVPDLQVIKREGLEEAGQEISEENFQSSPEYNPDFLYLNDRVLSAMFRRRTKIYAIGDDYISIWKDTTLPRYAGAKVLDYRGNMQEAIDTRQWSIFKDGDWAELVKQIGPMTEEERDQFIKKAERKGQRDGN